MTKLWIYSDGKNATNFKTTKYYHLTNKMLLYKYVFIGIDTYLNTY